MLRICGALGFINLRACSSSDGDSVGLRFGLFLEFPASFLHLALEFLNLNQVLRIEGQRRVIAIRFVGAETTVSGLLTPRFHCRRQPQTLKVPVVITEVA